MKSAVDTLLETLDALDQASRKLSVPPLGSTTRTSDQLLFNGLQIIAFLAMEEFFKSRTLEVLRQLVKPAVKFTDLPDELQSQLIQEWLKGLSTYLLRKESDSLQTLLHETEIIGSTSPTQSTIISDLSFGKSQSNITSTQIKALLDALLLDGFNSMAQVSKLLNLTHLGAPDQIFTRLSANRHAAAHGFSPNFKLVEFQDDLKGGCRCLALCFDTCISQAAFEIQQCIGGNIEYAPIDATKFKIQIILWDSIKNAYSINEGGVEINSVAKSKFGKKLSDLKKRISLTSETVTVSDSASTFTTWIQPI